MTDRDAIGTRGGTLQKPAAPKPFGEGGACPAVAFGGGGQRGFKRPGRCGVGLALQQIYANDRFTGGLYILRYTGTVPLD